MAEFRFINSDSVSPTEIEHKCDEIFDGETLEQKYNFIDYHFHLDGRYFRARTYTDDIGTVSVHGPFDGRDTLKSVPGPLDEGMLSYFKRRFRKITTLGSETYEVVWSR